MSLGEEKGEMRKEGGGLTNRYLGAALGARFSLLRENELRLLPLRSSDSAELVCSAPLRPLREWS